MEDGQVNQSLFMGVVSHGYGGLGLLGMEVVVGNHLGQSQILVACREMPEHFWSAM